MRQWLRAFSMADMNEGFRHETERLILRDWREDDWLPFWEGTNTLNVMRWLGGVCDAEKRQAAQDRLLSYTLDHGHTFWCVERKEDGAILVFAGSSAAIRRAARSV